MALLLIVVLFGVTIVAWPYGHATGEFRAGQGTHRAVLIDSLSATDSDQGFINNVTTALTSAGYPVDYYGPSQVTVNLFQSLPFMGYSMVIFRTHTATGGGEAPGQNIVTHQPYTTSSYSFEQLINHVTAAIVRPGDTFFAITPTFISDQTNGAYHGALIIQMGCSTLQARPDLATAFLGKGASAFVGWDGIVSSYYTDIATERFLASYLHGDSLSQAVGNAGGPDPVYGAKMTYVDASSVSQQLMINETATIVGTIIILGIALIIIRRQGFLSKDRPQKRRSSYPSTALSD